MLNAQQTQDAINALPSTMDVPHGQRDRRVALAASNRNETALIEGQFRAYLEATYATEIPAGAYDALFGQAWRDSHSDGYGDVELRYQDLAVLATVVLNAQ